MKKVENSKGAGPVAISCDGPFALKVVCGNLNETKETFKELYDKMYRDYEKLRKDKKEQMNTQKQEDMVKPRRYIK